MATIKEAAMAYEPIVTKNIADLEKVDVNMNFETKEYTDFSIDVIEIDGEDYRVPKIVLNQLKEHLTENPKLEYFKVKKSGEGKKGTKYTVIPLIAHQ